MKWSLPTQLLTALCIFSSSTAPVQALDLDTSSPSNIREVAKKVAGELVSMYAKTDNGNVEPLSGIPGLLTYPPYYWWEAGAMFGQLIDYWYYTKDTQYNDMVRDGILHQIGDEYNFMPGNQSKDEGNDDQLFWAFTVMDAAEVNFPNPPSDKPGWLALAQSVMNQLNTRYQTELDDKVCGGGLRWQIYQWLNGYNYKNVASNGGMFQLAARLAKYTGNTTYADWAERSFEWLKNSPLISDTWQVFDGTDVTKGCSDADQTQWTYNYGIMIGGAAYMYNYTNGSEIWQNRIEGFLNHSSYFFPKEHNNVMMEVCEPSEKCNIDQVSFKAYLARWLAICAQLAPFTYDRIMPLLQHSAQAAAQSCTGGDSGYQCGVRWYMQGFDGSGGVGQQMSALSIISANLISEVAPPVSDNDGGTSKGNPSLGTGETATTEKVDPITTADKAGASIITILVVIFVVGGGAWLLIE